MKPFLLLLSLLISVPVFSQNYRTVLVDKEVYFDFKDAINSVWLPHDGNLSSRIIATDSFQVFGNDTIIYHQMNQEFEESRDSNGIDCYFAIDTGFMGIQTLLQYDGVDIYFNRFQDSIFIQTQANLNDAWLFYTDSIGNYYEATISNIGQEVILGITDSVKIITLQAKDSLGNNISSPYDSLRIKISKHHGLIEGFNLFQFPYGTTTKYYSWKRYNRIKLIGLPHLNAGVNNLTASEIYDFAIGDEFQRLMTWNYPPPFGTYELIKINGKHFSSNNDTVFYNLHLTEFEFNYFTSTIDTIYIGDTIFHYNISSNNQINTKTLLLDTSNNLQPVLWVQSADGQTKSPKDNYYYVFNACIPIPFPMPGGERYYRKGFGLYEWNYYTLWDSYQSTVIYYKKNGVISGTPITIDMLVASDNIQKTDNILKVFPNPTNNLLNFQFTEPIQNAEIRIYSSIGQLMLNQNVNDTNVQFQVSDWSKGVYFYGIYVEGEVVKQGQVLIQD